MSLSTLPPLTNVQWGMVGILGLLVVATAVLAVLKKLKPQADLSELSQRVRSWWIMAAIFLLSVSVSRIVSLVFFAFVSFLALKEFLSLVPTRYSDRSVLFWAYLAIPIQYFWIYCDWYGMFIIFVPVYMFLFLPLRMVLIGDTAGFLRAAGTLHWGLMMAVFSLSHVAYLLIDKPADPGRGNPHGGGVALVLFLVVLTQLNDVAQYIWGKSFGRRKVLPKVSPGKTEAGLLGGVATTVALALLLAPILTPFGWRDAALAGVLISLAGFVGDVVISALKRDLGIKDSGTLLPGHGGILDRVDALLVTGTLTYLYVIWVRG